MTTVKDIVSYLEQLAPPSLAESWDHVGLQWGRSSQSVQTVALALTPSLAMIDKAIEINAQLLITHHPLIFGTVDRVNDQTPLGNMLLKMAECQLSQFCAHTNLDITDKGVNDVLAAKLSLHDTQLLMRTNTESYYKMIIFIPESHHNQLRNQLFAIGCGQSADYHECSWQSKGEGTFLPYGDQVAPFCGQKGERNYVAEVRLEILVPASLLKEAQKTISKYHPYEKPAYDVFLEQHLDEYQGLGRVGYLQEAVEGSTFIEQVKEQLNLPVLRYAGNAKKNIQKIALCGGSGASLIDLALENQCDAYITGDLKFHDAQKAYENDIFLVDAGHFHTERPVIEALQQQLSKAFPYIDFIALQEKDFFTYR